MDVVNKPFHGYKAFNKGLTNVFGKEFKVGEKYVVNDKHKGYGYHFCEYLEDVFVYYTGEDKQICEVIGSGDTIIYNNDYYGVYDVYSSTELYIVIEISREEIIKYFLDMSSVASFRIINFIIRFKMTKDEIDLFLTRFANNKKIIDAINYYQLGMIDLYDNKKLVKLKKNQIID